MAEGKAETVAVTAASASPFAGQQPSLGEFANDEEKRSIDGENAPKSVAPVDIGAVDAAPDVGVARGTGGVVGWGASGHAWAAAGKGPAAGAAPVASPVVAAHQIQQPAASLSDTIAGVGRDIERVTFGMPLWSSSGGPLGQRWPSPPTTVPQLQQQRQPASGDPTVIGASGDKNKSERDPPRAMSPPPPPLPPRSAVAGRSITTVTSSDTTSTVGTSVGSLATTPAPATTPPPASLPVPTLTHVEGTNVQDHVGEDIESKPMTAGAMAVGAAVATAAAVSSKDEGLSESQGGRGEAASVSPSSPFPPRSCSPQPLLFASAAGTSLEGFSAIGGQRDGFPQNSAAFSGTVGDAGTGRGVTGAGAEGTNDGNGTNMMGLSGGWVVSTAVGEAAEREEGERAAGSSGAEMIEDANVRRGELAAVGVVGGEAGRTDPVNEDVKRAEPVKGGDGMVADAAMASACSDVGIRDGAVVEAKAEEKQQSPGEGSVGVVVQGTAAGTEENEASTAPTL